METRPDVDDGAEGELPLEVELDRLDLYIDLQQMRIGPRLTLRRDVAGEALGARVPAMLLQPLVENALTHGIARSLGLGRSPSSRVARATVSN